MKFGPAPVEECEGTVLAHAIALKGRRLKKGHLLTKTDIGDLRTEHHREIIVARLDADDIAEDQAATEIAAAIVSARIRAEPAFTGRVNLYADTKGLFQADKAQIDELNRIDPAITLATLPQDTYVEKDRMVATVKIIPFATKSASVAAARKIAGERPLIDVAPFIGLHVGLIQTTLPTLKKSAMTKTNRVLFNRLQDVDSIVLREERVPHNAEALAAALTKLPEACGLIIIFGASAIADRADVIPAAMEQAGGRVDYFGMPVDPGNLLLTGELNGTPVIGAPGCARSPSENGFDWVLNRIVAGLPVGQDYVTGLGVGGLLMEIHARPQPREERI